MPSINEFQQVFKNINFIVSDDILNEELLNQEMKENDQFTVDTYVTVIQLRLNKNTYERFIYECNIESILTMIYKFPNNLQTLINAFVYGKFLFTNNLVVEVTNNVVKINTYHSMEFKNKLKKIINVQNKVDTKYTVLVPLHLNDTLYYVFITYNVNDYKRFFDVKYNFKNIVK